MNEEDIKQAIFDFLTSEDQPSDTVRRDAKDTIRELIGENIFRNDRRPTGVTGPALTLAYSGGGTLDGLTSPISCVRPVISFTLWSEDGPDASANDRAYRALRQLLVKYRGPLNPHITTKTIHLEAEPFDRSTPPLQGSDNWRHRKTFSFEFVFEMTMPSTV